MANKVYHIGHEPPQVTAESWTTNSSFYDPVFSRSAAYASAYAVPKPVSVVLKGEVETGTAEGYWITARQQYNCGWSCYDGNHFVIECLADDDTISCGLHWNDSTDKGYVRVYTDDDTYSDSDLFDITINTQHTLRCYQNGDSVQVDYYNNSTLSGSVSRAGSGRGIKTLVLHCTKVGNDGGAFWSEIAITNFDLTGHRVKTLPPTGAGTYSETTGGWSSISEVITDSNDARFTALNQRLSYTTDGLDDHLLNRPIVAVSSAALAYTDGTNNLQSFLRIDSADYEGEVVKEASATPGMCNTILLENPATASEWVGDLSDIEFGFKAVAP